MTYKLNDVYACMQGEGCQAGVPMALVRLHGCSVGCPWCDTRETWDAEPPNQVYSLEACLGTNPLWCAATPGAVAAKARELAGPGVRWALLTGGEPAEQPLAPLVAALHREGFRVALETSGTALGFLGANADWVCVSPKLGMPGGRKVLDGTLAAADEIKMPVGRQADIDALDRLLAEHPHNPDAQICLQPLSQSDKATDLCIATAKARGWRVSLQMHKYLGER